MVLLISLRVGKSIRVTDKHRETTRLLLHNAGIACRVVGLSDKLGTVLDRIGGVLLVGGGGGADFVGVDFGGGAAAAVSVNRLTRVTHCFLLVI